LSKIISIGTAVPAYKHEQKKIFDFMQRVYAVNETERRKLKFLYNYSGIETRYSVLPDFTLPADQWEFFSAALNLERLESFPSHVDHPPQHTPQANRSIAQIERLSITQFEL
jgi:predicted naringenin-chalcone synthase